MAGADTRFSARLNRPWLAHSIRTTIAAIASLYIARRVGLPEAYWSTITTLVVMQSTLEATLTPSRQRFVGTSAGSRGGSAGGHIFRREYDCVHARYFCARAGLRSSTPGSKRLSLCGYDTCDCHIGVAQEGRLGCRGAPIHRSVDWHRRRSADHGSLARARS